MRDITLAAVLIAGPYWASGANANDTRSVVLHLKDSGFELSGELRSYDGEKYVLAAPSIGVMSIDAARFDCEGEACRNTPAVTTGQSTFAIEPVVAAERQSFAIDGSAVIGLELMPSLIRDYAQSMGGAAKQVISGARDEVQFKITDAHGAEVSIIDLKRRSSAEAFTELVAGHAAVGMSSRPISAAEADAMPAIAGGIHGPEGEMVLALDALAILVAPGNPAKSLPVEVIARIFSGRISNWSELGLPAGSIKLYLGDSGTGASEGFDELVMRPYGLAVFPGARRLRTESELSDAVARDPHGIGIASLAFLRNAKALAVAGPCGLTTAPTVFAVKSEEYPLTRRLYLYTAGTGTRKMVRDLLAFASSDAAQATIQNSQFIDQSIDQMPYSSASSRFDLAFEAAGTKRERARLPALVKDLKTAKRLSATLRFASGSSQLDAKAREDVERLKKLLHTPEMKAKKVLFVGYADSAGSATANADLSYRRAEQIRDAVVGEAASERSVSVHGVGSLAPVACNDETKSKQLNRRVEVWVRD
ncbi:MAG: phosphate ABC transporter substrate-binding/OmpA family protein [Hyphomicrobium sp.]